MKDPIDKFLEKYSPSYIPVEREERRDSSPPADKPQQPKLSEQQRWDNSMKAMGWTHLVGMKKEEGITEENMIEYIKGYVHATFPKKP